MRCADDFFFLLFIFLFRLPEGDTSSGPTPSGKVHCLPTSPMILEVVNVQFVDVSGFLVTGFNFVIPLEVRAVQKESTSFYALLKLNLLFVCFGFYLENCFTAF